MTLLEAEPDEIGRYCASVIRAGPERAKHMLNPLIALDYDRMDPQMVEQVEDALYFGMLGVERPRRSHSDQVAFGEAAPA